MRSDPSDTGGLFVGRRPGTQPVHYRTDPVFGDARSQRRDAVLAALILAVIVAFLGILLTLVAALAVLKQLDRAWILVRRAAGYDQRDGVIGRVFAYTAFVGVTLFGLWMVFGGGLAQMGESSTPTPP